MKNKTLLIIGAIGFWVCAIILVIHFFENPFKYDTSLEKYNTKLNGKWKRTSDSLKVEYISHPTNKFQALNNVKFVTEDNSDSTTIMIGEYKIYDIKVIDTINNIYEVIYIDAFKREYGDTKIRLLNDTTFILSNNHYDYKISQTYIKTND